MKRAPEPRDRGQEGSPEYGTDAEFFTDQAYLRVWVIPQGDGRHGGGENHPRALPRNREEKMQEEAP